MNEVEPEAFGLGAGEFGSHSLPLDMKCSLLSVKCGRCWWTKHLRTSVIQHGSTDSSEKLMHVQFFPVQRSWEVRNDG